MKTYALVLTMLCFSLACILVRVNLQLHDARKTVSLNSRIVERATNGGTDDGAGWTTMCLYLNGTTKTLTPNWGDPACSSAAEIVKRYPNEYVLRNGEFGPYLERRKP